MALNSCKIIKKIIVSLCILSILLMNACSSDVGKNTNNIKSDINEKNKTLISEQSVGDLSIRGAVVETKWFYLTVPQSWIGSYSCDEVYDEKDDIYELKFRMNTKNSNDSGLLFTIEMSPLSDTEYISVGIRDGWLNPMGVITSDEASYFVSNYPSSEAACSDDELDKFITMSDDITKCLQTFSTQSTVGFEEWTGDIIGIEANEDSDKSIDELYEMVILITDNSLIGLIGDFFNLSVKAALASVPQNYMPQLLEFQSRMFNITNPIINAKVPSGYGLQEKWKNLSDICSQINSATELTIDSVCDKDLSAVLEIRDYCNNIELFEKAVYIRNTLQENISDSVD